MQRCAILVTNQILSALRGALRVSYRLELMSTEGFRRFAAAQMMRRKIVPAGRVAWCEEIRQIFLGVQVVIALWTIQGILFHSYVSTAFHLKRQPLFSEISSPSPLWIRITQRRRSVFLLSASRFVAEC